MAKITALTADAAVLDTDLCVTVEDPSGTPATKKATWATIGVLFAARSETLTNKTINGASNTLTVRLASDVSGTLPIANGGTGATSIGSSGTFAKSNGTIVTWANIAASDVTSGTFVHERGGLEADVSAYNGLVKISGGSTSAVSLPLSAANGGLGQDSSGWTGIAYANAGTWSAISAPLGDIVGDDDVQTLENKTINASDNTLTVDSGAAGDLLVHDGTSFVRLAKGSALQVLRVNSGATGLEFAAVSATPAGSSGDIQTNSAGSFGAFTPGSGVVTMLTTFSSANIRSACSDETGSGALVFGTSPTLTTPQIDGGRVEANTFRLSGVFTISGTTGGDNIAHGGARIIRLTNATPPTITGVSASGVEDGEMLIIVNAGGVTTLANDATSTAANRLLFTTGADVAFGANAVAVFFYDATTQRWRCVCANAI